MPDSDAVTTRSSNIVDDLREAADAAEGAETRLLMRDAADVIATFCFLTGFDPAGSNDRPLAPIQVKASASLPRN